MIIKRNSKTIKLLALLLSVAMMGVLLCGCSFGTKEEEEPNTPTNEELIAKQYSELTSELQDAPVEKVMQYIADWGKDNNFKVKKDKMNNVIITSPSTSPDNKYASTAIQSNISGKPGAFGIEMQNVALSMYTITNLEEHGKVKLIFTSDSDRFLRSSNHLTKKDLNVDNIVCLGYDDGNHLITDGAAIKTYLFTHSLKRVKPNYNTAYKIHISGLTGNNSGDLSKAGPNAITIFSSLLAHFKTKSMLFELADFNGGDSAFTYAKSCDMTIVINDTDIEKFEKAMDTTISKFNKKYVDNQKNTKNIIFDYEQIDIPKNVLTTKSSDRIISSLYTMIDGIYNTNDDTGEIVALSNISYIRTTSNEFILKASCRSISNNILEEMDMQIGTIATLSDLKETEVFTSNVWHTDDESSLVHSFNDASKKGFSRKFDPKNTFELTHGSVFVNKNTKANIILFETNSRSWEETSKTLIYFLNHADLSNEMESKIDGSPKDPINDKPVLDY